MLPNDNLMVRDHALSVGVRNAGVVENHHLKQASEIKSLGRDMTLS